MLAVHTLRKMVDTQDESLRALGTCCEFTPSTIDALPRNSCERFAAHVAFHTRCFVV